MKKKTTHKNIQGVATAGVRKAYQTPRLKVVGRVSDLTLKVGSNTDGFGGAFS